MRTVLRGLAGVMAAGFLLLMSGCSSEDLDSFVTDVKSQVSDSAPAAAVSGDAAGQPVAESTAAPTSVIPLVPSVSPEELVARFVATAPGLITGRLIKDVADVPAAAEKITAVDVTGADLTGAELAPLAAMKNLQTLSLAGNPATASELSFVSELPALDTLSLQSTNADDSVLAEVGKLSHLRSLNLFGTSITGAGLSKLSGLLELQELNLSTTRITDESMAALSSLPIQTLTVRNSAIGDAGLAEIAKIATLQSLDVSTTRITGAGCKVLARLELKSFDASQTQFGVDGLVSIKGIKSLEELTLFRASIVEQPKANVFRGMPNLRALNLGGNKISDQGLHVLFKGWKRVERLEVAGSIDAITNRGLEALIGCENLQYLDVTGSQVTSAATADLKAILKNPGLTTRP